MALHLSGQARGMSPQQDRPPLERGGRRALPVPPVIALSDDERARLLAEAQSDPEREWLLQEFDGRAYVTVARVRGPRAREAHLQRRSG